MGEFEFIVKRISKDAIMVLISIFVVFFPLFIGVIDILVESGSPSGSSSFARSILIILVSWWWFVGCVIFLYIYFKEYMCGLRKEYKNKKGLM